MTELSKREEFVKAAMQAIIECGHWSLGGRGVIEKITITARKIADAQLKELRDNPSEYKTPSYSTGPG